ncbi:hypothetical protein J8273_2959 [Carpediemonas membranifera]|uniref:Uncharacterized protein n=1 Tax=Carpediemonas membranifera TaxID=201153 RepID=A0A8J6E576_9EUKA|nr:hypothetical protein J8273_2959 [Carpediemonas membranifera]|eukprot:KAG9395392.1 hypothetical protein J8273_2959 [Carpediemonas membranifera]
MGVFKRSKKYEKSDSTPETDNKSDEAIVRARLQTMKVAPVFSPDWQKNHAALRAIAKVAAVEQSKPDNSPTNTLWEREEFVVRLVLESAKLTIILTLLTESFDEEERIMDVAVLEKAGKMMGCTSKAAVAEYYQYRSNLCLLFKCCLDYVESVQLIDLTILVRLMARNFGRIIDNRLDAGQAKSIFMFQIFYMYNIGRRIEEINSAKVIAAIIESDCMRLYLDCLFNHRDLISQEILITAFEGLSALSDSEAFQDVLPQIIDVECAKMITSNDAEVLQPILAIPEENLRLSPLIDLINHSYKVMDDQQ